MKKFIGITLLILGAIIFLWCACACIDYMTTTKAEVIAKFERTGFARGMRVTSYDRIDKQLIAARIATGIMAVMGVAIAYGGRKLFKKGLQQK